MSSKQEFISERARDLAADGCDDDEIFSIMEKEFGRRISKSDLVWNAVIDERQKMAAKAVHS